MDVIFNLSAVLSKRGHRVTVLTSDLGLDPEYVDSLKNVDVRAYHCSLNLAGFLVLPSMIGTVKRNLKDFDVIHLHCHRSFQNVVVHHYAKKYGVPYVLDTHGDTPRSVNGRGLKWLFKCLFDISIGRRIVNDASWLIGQNEMGCNEYIEAGARHPERIVSVTPMRDMKQFDHLPVPGMFRQRYGLDNKRIVMFLGRLNRIKGLDFLVQSFALLAKSRTDVTLVLVGSDDGHKLALEKLAGELGITERVLFTGFLQGEAKLAALVDADVLIQPSIYEQGVWAPYEAVLCNTPIILTASGAGEEVRKADTGYVVEYGDKKGLSDKIAYVLDNPAEVAAKTRRAKEYIRANLSLEKGVENYERLYDACVKQGTLPVEQGTAEPAMR